jgi:hypothetical protein
MRTGVAHPGFCGPHRIAPGISSGENAGKDEKNADCRHFASPFKPRQPALFMQVSRRVTFRKLTE